MTSHALRRSLAVLLLAVASACGEDTPDPVDPGTGNGGGGTGTINAGCTNTTPAAGSLAILGCGRYSERYTAEVWVRGSTAYTTTWGTRGTNRGNAIMVWDVSGAAPTLVDSVVVATGATTIGDVQVSEDGRTLVVATEPGPLALLVYDLANPRKPTQVSSLTVDGFRGAHTAELGQVGGRLHAFLAQYPNAGGTARVTVVDLGTPSAPTVVLARSFPGTTIHDTFYRDGVLFLALWNQGLVIWDVGGFGRGGTIANPVEIGRIATVGGAVHNAWWFHDPTTGAKRYVFVGEEQPGAIGSGSAGDIHVVDVATPSAPREVAFYTLAGAGTHNFSVDEPRGVLYAAYYNGGVRALDVRGDLGSCTAAQKDAQGRCNLALMGRELAKGLTEVGTFSGVRPAYIWGVQFVDDTVYASDMMNGLWKLRPVQR